MDYNATLTLTTGADDDELVDRLIDYHPAVSPSTAIPDAWEATITLPATNLGQALTTARALAADLGELHGLEVIPTRAWDRRQNQPPDIRLVSVTEAAEHLGVTPQAVRERLAAGTLAGTKIGRNWAVPAATVGA